MLFLFFAVTPFTFKGNQSELNLTIGSTKKKFDLQASLAKPITWRMHKGPLKPLGEESKNHASPILHKTDVKKAKVASRFVQSLINLYNLNTYERVSTFNNYTFNLFVFMLLVFLYMIFIVILAVQIFCCKC